MTPVNDTLELIDGAIRDWELSDDAMRWLPDWDEPVVRPAETYVERLVLQGWDGYAARAQFTRQGVITAEMIHGAVQTFAVQVQPVTFIVKVHFEYFLEGLRQGLRQISAALLGYDPLAAVEVIERYRLSSVPIKPSRRRSGWRR
jgi:hypothetical protein